MPDNRPIPEKIIDNIQKPCSVKHCCNYRYRIDPYCRQHRETRRYWGHPEAKAIRRNDYSCELEDVKEIIFKNLDHAGVKRGVEFFERWLKTAAAGSNSVPCPNLIARLYHAGVKPLDLVMEMSALWLLHTQSRGLVKSDLHLEYLMGSRLIRYIRYGGRTRGTQHLECGRYVRLNVGVLLVTVCRAVERKERNKRCAAIG